MARLRFDGPGVRQEPGWVPFCPVGCPPGPPGPALGRREAQAFAAFCWAADRVGMPLGRPDGFPVGLLVDMPEGLPVGLPLGPPWPPGPPGPRLGIFTPC